MRYRFDRFELSTAPLRLLRDGRPVAIQPQPARALELLLRRAGEIVSRQDLRRHIWGEGTYLDHEQGINFAMRQIRGVLGDDPRTARFIETVPRVGYRFVAPVETVDEPAPAIPANAPADAPPPRTWAVRLWPRPGWAIGTAAGLFLAAALVVTWWFWSPMTQAGPVCVWRLAVEPLVEAAGETGLGERLTEELVTDLAILYADNLGILAMPAGGDPWTVASPAPAYVLSGSVVRDRERARVTLRLWRVRDRVHVWGRVFERPLEAVPTWPREVSLEIGEALSVRPSASPPSAPAPL